PQLPAPDDPGRLAVVLCRAVLRADLDHAVVLLRRLDDRPAFADVVGQRLLDVDVLAGPAGEHGDGRVPVVGGADEDGVHVLAVEYLAEVLVRLAAGPGPLSGG